MTDDGGCECDPVGALGVEGCLFPGECCMPGLHYTSECYRAEDYEAIMAEVEE